MKRHNLAVEKLSKAREEYSKERQQRLDYLNKTISQRKHAEQTFGDLSVAMAEYHKVTGRQLPPLRGEPKLSDFYNPSRESEKIQRSRSLSVEWQSSESLHSNFFESRETTNKNRWLVGSPQKLVAFRFRRESPKKRQDPVKTSSGCWCK